MLTIVYFSAVRGFSIKLRSFVKAIVILFPITIGMRFFDLAFSGPPYKFNFMFLLSPPDISTPLDSFGHGWGYYFAIVAMESGAHVRSLPTLADRPSISANSRRSRIVKRASVLVSILYVACLVLTQVQIRVFTNRNWWGFPQAPSIDYLIRINIIYAIDTILLVLSIVGLIRGNRVSWLYFILSCGASLVWQTYLLTQRNILAFSGGGMNYVLMALEVAVCTLLIIEHPLFQKRKKSVV